MPDLTSRADIERLVDAFYDRVRSDELLAPIFDDIARVNWTAHLPRMYDFWESVLFGGTAFKGNPLAVHRQLAKKATLSATEFGRWIVLFHDTVDALFAGPTAEEAKARAVRIAATMQFHIDADQSSAVRFA